MLVLVDVRFNLARKPSAYVCGYACARVASEKPGLSHHTQEELFLSRPDKYLIASSIGNYLKLHSFGIHSY